MIDLARYLEPVEGPLRLCREQIVLPTGQRWGDVMDRDPWIERDILRPIFELGEDRMPAHKLAYIELPRGHVKSFVGAAVVIASEHGRRDRVGRP